MDKITVFLADWQVLFREGVHLTLSGGEDIDVIGEAADNDEVLKSIEANPPRVAILNSDRGKASGIDITRRIKKTLPSVSIVLVADNYDEGRLFSAMKSGASAYVTKEIDPDELVSIVREVAQGTCPLSKDLLKPGIASRVIGEFEAVNSIGKRADDTLSRLGTDERKILQHIVAGNSIEQLACALCISAETIRRHLDSIRTKLTANSHTRGMLATARNDISALEPRGIPDEAAASMSPAMNCPDSTRDK